MSCIHYKFKSDKHFDFVVFNGCSVTLTELKRLITRKEGMRKYVVDFDLIVTNDQTKEVYKHPSDLIQRNSSVIITRIPANGDRTPIDSNAVKDDNLTLVKLLKENMSIIHPIEEHQQVRNNNDSGVITPGQPKSNNMLAGRISDNDNSCSTSPDVTLSPHMSSFGTDHTEEPKPTTIRPILNLVKPINRPSEPNIDTGFDSRQTNVDFNEATSYEAFNDLTVFFMTVLQTIYMISVEDFMIFKKYMIDLTNAEQTSTSMSATTTSSASLRIPPPMPFTDDPDVMPYDTRALSRFNGSSSMSRHGSRVNDKNFHRTSDMRRRSKCSVNYGHGSRRHYPSRNSAERIRHRVKKHMNHPYRRRSQTTHNRYDGKRFRDRSLRTVYREKSSSDESRKSQARSNINYTGISMSGESSYARQFHGDSRSTCCLKPLVSDHYGCNDMHDTSLSFAREHKSDKSNRHPLNAGLAVNAFPDVSSSRSNNASGCQMRDGHRKSSTTGMRLSGSTSKESSMIANKPNKRRMEYRLHSSTKRPRKGCIKMHREEKEMERRTFGRSYKQ